MFSKSLSIARKDMKEWLRSPFLIVIAIAPILVISLVLGVFMSTAEVLPAGIIIQDNDPIAIEINEYMKDMKSGTGEFWFEITEAQEQNKDLVLDKFENGEILAYIIIPSNLTQRISEGEIVPIYTHINNIQDDITKNILQRIELVCNHINRQLSTERILHTPKIDFQGIVEQDITFQDYVLAAACGLAVILPAGANMSTSVSQEFEKGTIKELIMGASPRDIVIGKLYSTIIQTTISFSMVLIFNAIIFRFIPSGNIIFILGFVILGAFGFSGIGFIISSKIKQIIPSAIVVMIISIIAWYIGGGLVPPEIWAPSLKTFSLILPTTYFFRSFMTLVLLGNVSESMIIIDVFTVVIFGLLTDLGSYYIFKKEVSS